ncbi:hypothetical protein JL720_11452 [Aureococcus anophagefferens]|nr:hypothetical protein JL720_11452 [Aureococcus anophagefferens]
MGVQGLWKLLAPCGRRISVETLEHTTLAIDVSIWLTQFVKAMRDDEGRPIRNAHLIGTLRRVAKLLYHGVRPVFVFDGGVPVVKARLIRQRQMRREKNRDDVATTAKRLLAAQLKAQALRLRKRRRDGDDAGERLAPRPPANAAAPHDADSDDDVAWESDDGSGDAPAPRRSTRPSRRRDGGASSFDVDGLMALPPAQRKEAVERVNRRQRVAARHAFMPSIDEALEEAELRYIEDHPEEFQDDAREEPAAPAVVDLSRDDDGDFAEGGGGGFADDDDGGGFAEEDDGGGFAEEDGGFMKDDESGGFVKDDDEESGGFVKDGGGFVKDDDEESGGFVKDDGFAEEDDGGGFVKDDDEESGGFVKDDEDGGGFVKEEAQEGSDDDCDWEGGGEAAGGGEASAGEESAGEDGACDWEGGGEARGWPRWRGPAPADDDDDGDDGDDDFFDAPAAAAAAAEEPEEDRNRAAIAAAMQTADKMADWAGRAFRRALAEAGTALPAAPAPADDEPPAAPAEGEPPRRPRRPSLLRRRPRTRRRATRRPRPTTSGGASAALEDAAAGDGAEWARHRRAAEAGGFYDVCPDFDAQLRYALERASDGDLEAMADAAAARPTTASAVLAYVVAAARAAPAPAAAAAGWVDGDDDDMREDTMHLLRLLGVPYVVAPMEAEAQCAALEAAGLCEGVVTDDSDAFCFGARRVYKNIFDDRKYVEAYYASDCARDLRLGRDEFCALALLLGGDYDNGVAGVGVVNAMEVLQAFHFVEDGEPRDVAASLTRFKAWLDGGDGWADDGAVRAFAAKHRALARWETPPTFPNANALRAYLRPQVHDVDAVRRQLGGDDDGDDDRSPFKWGSPDAASLRALCETRLGWSDAATDAALGPMLERLQARSGGLRATRMDAYYETYHSNKTFATVTSTRLRAALAPRPARPARAARRRRRDEAAAQDPGAPKGRRSAYIFFGNAKRAEKPYAALATADAERYDREMAAYKATRPAAGAAEEEDEDEEGRGGAARRRGARRRGPLAEEPGGPDDSESEDLS